MEKEIIVCYDFDGTLNVYSEWRGHSRIGEPREHPVDGLFVIDVVKDLFEMGVGLKLSTTRLNPYPFGDGPLNKPEDMVVSGEARECIICWLRKHNVFQYFEEITGYKPYADLYVDDRGWDPTRKELMDRIQEWRGGKQ